MIRADRRSIQDVNAHEAIDRRRLLSLGLLAITLPVGIAWRMAPLHLPQFAFKFGGSALWAVAVYWLMAALQPKAHRLRLAGTAAAVALAVELCKLIWWPPLDRFRETLAGKLLLGRYFTFGAILAYWLAITAVALLDAHFLPVAGALRTAKAPIGERR